jgi:hypothetical protein
MGHMLISQEVIYRSELGRFLAACDEAATESVVKTLELGEKVAKGFAPIGAYDPRGDKIIDSFDIIMLSSRSGVIANSSGHALAQEKGAGPHMIGRDGQILYNPVKKWGPRRAPVWHPGNPPQPFLEPAYAVVRGRMIEIMKEAYPG